MSLSKRAYYLIGLIILVAIIGQWTEPGSSAWWRYPAALLIFALSIEGLRARLHAPRIEVHWPPQLALGETAQLTLALHNPYPKPLQLQTQWRCPLGLRCNESLLTWSIPAQQTLQAALPVTALALGQLTPGTLYSRQLGHLGLAWWSHKQACASRAQVLPRALTHREAGQGQIALGRQLALQRVGSGDDLLSLREYRQGDPLHAVDWKATAKRGTPIVRNYARQQQMDLLLIVDCGRSSRLQAGTLSRLHHYANVAARLAQLASLQGDHIGLLVCADRPLDSLPVASGLRNLPTLRDKLAQLRSQPSDFNPLSAALEARRLLRQRCLVVFLCEIEQQQAASQLVQACGLLAPKHLALIASLVDSDVEALETRTCSHWLDPYRRLAAHEYLRSQRATGLQLQRLGAKVVLSPPQDLDQRLLQRYRQLRLRQRV